MKNITLEICAGSLEDCLCAWENGIDRVELNADLSAGGLTPTAATLRLAKKKTGLKIICMDRPRPGGFCYTLAETEVMMEDARILLENGADGIAFGFLNEDKTIDRQKTKAMADLILSFHAEPFFHRAFDLTPDPLQAAVLLEQLGIRRILTSGTGETALQGVPVLARLHKTVSDRTEILPGCGVNAGNLQTILAQTGCRQAHASCRVFRKDRAFDSGQVDFSAESGSLHGQTGFADPAKIQALVQAAETFEPKKQKAEH